METTSAWIFGVVMYAYLAVTVIYLIYAVSRNQAIGRIATALLAGALALHTVGLVYRWIETHKTGYGYVPLSNMYESLIFFSWTIVLLYLVLELLYKQKTIGVFVTPFAFLFMALTAIIPGVNSEINPLVPALKSPWLAIHVITCFVGYAAFAVSFWFSLLYLIRESRERRDPSPSRFLPAARVLDEISYRSILIGFPMLTLGIVTGAAWANYAWGSYWSWDPKETWSLITWFVYAAFLHARLARGWSGRKAAFLSIIGFGAVIFTYFGVNYLISGLHSYA
ncbi:MAG: c-type cytochrome biogenesis protein CcsB [Deltaproteobacteria bacterium]|nr:c-type cytochrome biogenesis protein CcsB [Deltaproteobacteria bacterium]